MMISCHHRRQYSFTAATTALLVIDMQRDFLDPLGASGQAGIKVKHLYNIVSTLRTLMDASRAADIFIVHTREGHLPDLSDLQAAKREQYAASGIAIGEPGPLGRRFIRGEPGNAIVPELAPAPGELVVDKPGFGAFHATRLDDELKARGITHLILTGVTTQCCVHSTLREAVDRGYRCLTVADACATEDPALHEAVLSIIASEGHLFGWIADAADVVSALAPSR